MDQEVPVEKMARSSNRQKGVNRKRRTSHGDSRQQCNVASIHPGSVEKWNETFKTVRCTYTGNPADHDVRCCAGFHSGRDRRRHPLVRGRRLRYAAEPCKDQFDELGLCSQGDACGFCHNTAELLYHPDIFHKRLCQGKSCLRGNFCAFAHSRDDLLVPHFSEIEETEPTSDFMMNKFKTLWCPFGEPHSWETCVYAHTYRDFRRLPSLGYCSRPCPSWDQSLIRGSDLAYTERCRLGMACPCAHGAKEQLYHPDFYKTSPCDNKRCSKRVGLCAYSHGPTDSRLKPPSHISQRRLPIAGAYEYLQENQPTFKDPPKYLSLEEATHFTKASQNTTTSEAHLANDLWMCAHQGIKSNMVSGFNSDMLSTCPMQTYEAENSTCITCMPSLPESYESHNEMQSSPCYYVPVVVLQPIQIVLSEYNPIAWAEGECGISVPEDNVMCC